MSDKKEKDLSAITTFSGSHIIRVLTDAGVSVKATFANVAKWIIESYASSSLAGSNQSVKSAIDSLNSKYVIGRNTSSGETVIFDALSSVNLYQILTRDGLYTVRTWGSGGGIVTLIADPGVSVSMSGLQVSITFTSNNYLSVFRLF